MDEFELYIVHAICHYNDHVKDKAIRDNVCDELFNVLTQYEFYVKERFVSDEVKEITEYFGEDQ